MMTYREAAEYLGNYFEHTCWCGPNDPLHEASDMAINVLYMMDNIMEELIKSYTYGGIDKNSNKQPVGWPNKFGGNNERTEND